MRIDNETTIELILTREDPVIEFAAAELRRYLTAALGDGLHYLLRSHDRPELSVPETAARIVLNGGKSDPFGRDEFVLEITTDRVAITASSARAVLYGVYELLEQHVGIFWDKPGSERVPALTHLELEPVRRTIAPQLRYRGFYLDSSAQSMDRNNTVELIDWMAKKRANYLLVSVNFFEDFRDAVVPELERRGIVLEVGHHGFVNYVDPEEHLAAHPEWFSLVHGKRTAGFRRHNMTHDSQLCASNEEGLSYYADRIADYLRRYPEIDVIGIIPNDGRGWCECPDCRALENAVPDNLLVQPGSPDYHQMNASGRYHRIVSFVSHRLNQVHADAVGRRKLSFWAYNSTIMPSPTVREFPGNTVLSGFALFERCYAHGMGDEACDSYPLHLNGKYREIMAQWNDAYDGSKLIYEYYRKYIWLNKPKIMPELLRHDLAYFDHAGFEGVNSMCEADAWPIYEVNQHAFLDYCWYDRQLPGDAFIREFADRRLPGHGDRYARVLQDVHDIMAPFGLLGGRYPRAEIPAAIDRLERCISVIDEAAGDSEDAARTLAAWRQNLTYLREAFRSDACVLDLIAAGSVDAASLDELLQADGTLLALIETLDNDAFLHSGYVANRIGRRMDEIETLRKRGDTVTEHELMRIWHDRWF